MNNNDQDGYDETLYKFAEYRETNVRQPVEHYTIHNCMLKQFLDKDGLLTGKRVLDLACGHGYYTRELKALGCSYILGIDESPTMIALARDSKWHCSEDIEYMVADVKSLPPLQSSFDLITAFYLFDYAQTSDELLSMVRFIYAQLGESKTFIGVIGNVTGGKDMFNNRKYGITRETKLPFDGDLLPDSTEIIVTMYDTQDMPMCSFSNYHYSPTTYEQVFKEVGFKTFQWVPYQCDPNDPNGTFFEDLIHNAPSIGIIATK
ncbi:unnamed protein product [Rotaria socialis]|uniref:Methyltransferase domain-containing protein n=1 Tax=Rotaria socialis TaxID=392032 RepID=A0A820S5P5_9BILA|nr:unnamed protein product [Rotaria socialis]CAF3279327.1 unnamed protein product [Rotaria socialis]CAF3357074.1 unnamed protein product [Rotaria socialis]CAF3725512.1 unnamed protein product [Rotaria socialis]CAF4299841.1 unnamed protein product [Rotaria socialis]